MKFIDDILNKITMYRLLTYGLSLLAGLSLFSAAIGAVSLPLFGLIASLFIVVAVGFCTNTAIARMLSIPSNKESWYITALILFFILPPVTSVQRAIYLVIAVIIAISSKYLLTLRGQHVFNPAALGAFLVGLFGFMHTSWWVASNALLIANILLALTILRKTRKFRLFASFATASIVVSLLLAAYHDTSLIKSIDYIVTASPLFFLGSIMLTEPITMPKRYRQQLGFGALVGVLYAWHPSIGPVFIYPETALLIGNVFAAAVSPKQHVSLTLKRVDKISPRVHNYVFRPSRSFAYKAGQYAEWTLPGSFKALESNRRTFTIASSPTEKEVHLGIRISDPSSAYKTALSSAQLGDIMHLHNVMGDFVLPSDQNQKIVMVAGGIGITPFRSMIKSITDKNESRDIVLMYCVSDETDVAYKAILEDAAKHGVKTMVISPRSAYKKLSPQVIQAALPDLDERFVYISGPSGFVELHKKTFHALGARKLITDHFSGY